MCGIAGFIAPKGARPGELAAMADAMRHRGPNGFGYAVAKVDSPAQVVHGRALTAGEEAGAAVGFAHRRLSIFDLSEAGAQPMADAARELVLCYNGEIYNWLELREELRTLGHQFHTESDTEVVLRAYEQWGVECTRRLSGMWAFALLDRRRGVVMLSRDRFGIKPLYLAEVGGTLYFASEIKALLALPGIPRAPHAPTMARFLANGLVDITHQTFFEGIRQFPAAHSALVTAWRGSPEVRPTAYWDFPQEPFEGSADAAVARFRDLFLESVRSHSHADVPVGTCLSGGLDSSAIVSAAATFRGAGDMSNYKHVAFGYCASDPQFSEKHYMDVVVKATGADMHYVTCSDDRFLEVLGGIVQGQDEPFGSASIVVQWLVFEAAKAQGITVMLDGQGADEVLGGYHHFLRTLALHHLHQRRFGRFLGLRNAHERELGPLGISLKGALHVAAPDFLRRAARALLGSHGSPGTAATSLSLSPTTRELKSAFVPESYGTLDDDLNATLRRYVSSICLPALLRYEDRNSMAHSIEARVPFLDHRIVDHAFSLPGHFKIRGATTKYLMREGLRGILPEPIRTRRDKIGFKATPSLTFDFASRAASALIENQTAEEREWFDPAGVRALLASPRSTESELAIWRVVNAKLWLREVCAAPAARTVAA